MLGGGVDGGNMTKELGSGGGYEQDTPLSSHRRQDGRCLPHFLFAIAQALQAFFSTGGILMANGR